MLNQNYDPVEFEAEVKRWEKKLKNPNIQAKLMLRLILEYAETSLIIAEKYTYSTDEMRDLLARMSKIIMEFYLVFCTR